MKKIILILLVASSLYSQEKVTKVEYDYYNNLNNEYENLKGGKYTPVKKAYLYYTKDKSCYEYKVYDTKKTISLKTKGILSSFIPYKDITISGGHNGGKKELIFINNNKIYTHIDFILGRWIKKEEKNKEGKTVLYLYLVYTEDKDTVKPNWEIINEVKVIKGYNCKKAKTTFYGREYIVWFTEDLKINKGPWKLNGLPGLIVYAKDKEEKISWELNNLKYNQEYKYIDIEKIKNKNSTSIKFIPYNSYLKKQTELIKEKVLLLSKKMSFAISEEILIQTGMDTSNDKIIGDGYKVELMEKKMTP